MSSARLMQFLRAGAKALGVEVRAIRPDDSPELLVEASLAKQVLIAQRLEHLPPQLLGEVDDAHDPVIEG